MLKHLVCGPSRESLIGDLTEQYQLKRSATWYWRQTLMTVLVGAARDVRAHKLIAVRGVIIGWLFLWLLLLPISYRVSHLDDWLFEIGLVDVRPWWPNHSFLTKAFTCVGGLCIGRIVVQWHRISMVLVFAASVLLFMVFWFCLVVAPYTVETAYRSNGLVLITFAVVHIILLPASIVLGGLLAADRERGASPDVSLSTP
jgi:uncharacterized membrane protein